MKRFSILAVLALALWLAPAVVFADASCPGVGNDCTQTINQGGSAAAAASATGGSVEGSGNSTNTNVNTNVNDLSNRNYNQDVNVLHQGQGQRQGQLQGQQQGQGQGQGQKQKTNVNVQIEGDKTEIPAQAPAVFSPNLTSSPEACMGSISGGGGAGFNGVSFGFNLGSTWTNQECQDRMNARTLSALGQNQAALEYLAAANPKIAASLKRAGVKVAVNEEQEKKAEEPKQTSQVVPAPASTQQGAVLQEKRVSEVLGEAMEQRLAQNRAAVESN